MKPTLCLLITALLLLSACDRTHPDIKLLTQTRESITPLSLDTTSISAHPGLIRAEVLDPDYPDELLITPDHAILAINDAVEEHQILEAIDFEAPKSARYAFKLEPHEGRLQALSGLERKAHKFVLLLVPDVSIPVLTLTHHAQRALAMSWHIVALRISHTKAIVLTPPRACDAPEEEATNPMINRGDHGTEMALMGDEGGECEAVTLHWLEDGSWVASLRGAMASGKACLTVPAREEPGAYDALDTITCDRATSPDELLDVLATSYTLCDTITLNPTGSQHVEALGTHLEQLLTHRAARHVTLAKMPAPTRPETCL